MSKSIEDVVAEKVSKYVGVVLKEKHIESIKDIRIDSNDKEPYISSHIQEEQPIIDETDNPKASITLTVTIEI